MIGSLRGEIINISTDVAVLEVHGVGYEVRMPSTDIAQLHIGDHAFLYTVLSVSQDNLALYGFSHATTKFYFLELQKVNGIGAKAALSILSTLTTSQLVEAINNNDVAMLTRAPGLGKKTAQKIILELNGKIVLDDAQSDGRNHDSSPSLAGRTQVVEGLISLGWQQALAIQAVERVCEQEQIEGDIPKDSIPQILRQSLIMLDSGK